MKILMINIVCGIRSTGRICTDVVTALDSDYEVKIAYGRESVPEQFKNVAVRIGSDTDVWAHCVFARISDACGFGSKKATERFINWVIEYDPDVIHLHNIHGYYINIELLFDYLKTCGKRILWTLHDGWAFTGHSAFCDAMECERWISGCHDCPYRMEYPKSFIDKSKRNWEEKRRIFRDVPNLTIVTPSKWLADRVKNSFLSQYEVLVINSGIDTSQFYPIESSIRSVLKIGERTMLLGVASTWNEMKGYSDFIELAGRLGDEYCIVMVGVDKRQKEKLPHNVIGLERTNNVKELAQLYTAADIFLNLSYCENYPTVNLEAIACGTPVLTYNVGGGGENAGPEAIIVERGNLDSVVDGIRKYEKKRINVDRTQIDKIITARKYDKLYIGAL